MRSHLVTASFVRLEGLIDATASGKTVVKNRLSYNLCKRQAQHDVASANAWVAFYSRLCS